MDGFTVYDVSLIDSGAIPQLVISGSVHNMSPINFDFVRTLSVLLSPSVRQHLGHGQSLIKNSDVIFIFDGATLVTDSVYTYNFNDVSNTNDSDVLNNSICNLLVTCTIPVTPTTVLPASGTANFTLSINILSESAAQSLEDTNFLASVSDTLAAKYQIPSTSSITLDNLETTSSITFLSSGGSNQKVVKKFGKGYDGVDAPPCDPPTPSSPKKSYNSPLSMLAIYRDRHPAPQPCGDKPCDNKNNDIDWASFTVFFVVFFIFLIFFLVIICYSYGGSDGYAYPSRSYSRHSSVRSVRKSKSVKRSS